MNEHPELSSNPYGDEAQVPYESWEENKTANQETQPSTPSTPQISSATPQQGQPPAVTTPPQWQTPPGVSPQSPQWYGYYPYATPAVPVQTALVPQKDGYLQGLAITTIIGSVLLIIAGLVGIVATIITLFNLYNQTTATDLFHLLALYLSISGMCLVGGGLSLYHSIRSVLKKPSTTVILPPFWTFLIPYIVLLAGLFAIQAIGGEIPLVLVVLILLVLVSLFIGFAFIAFNWRLLPSSASLITWRHMTVAFISGATAPFFLMVLLNTFVNIGLSYAIYNCGSSNPAAYCSNGTQFITTTVVLITIIGSIIQQTITPLLLAFYIRKIQKAGEALLLGLACGTGFGIMESAATIGSSYHNWIGILLTSLGMIILNGTGSALLALGWFHVLNPDQRQLLKAAGYWLWAVAQQTIFSLLPLAFLAPALDAFLKSWNIPVGTGVVSFYEIGYIAGIIIILVVFLYLMQRLRKEEIPSPENATPSTEIVTPSIEVSSDVSEEMSSDV
jgi:hypothetical protein